MDLRAVEFWLVKEEVSRNVGIRQSPHTAMGQKGDEPLQETTGEAL